MAWSGLKNSLRRITFPLGPGIEIMMCADCGYENLAEAQFCARCGASLVPTVGSSSLETEPTPPSVQPATSIKFPVFWRRFGAGIIDFGIVVCLLILGLSPLLFFVAVCDTGFCNNAFGVIWIGVALLWLLLPGLYFVLFTGISGQTLGKKFVRIKVVNAQGNIPVLGHGALREVVGKIISTIPLRLGFFWIGWNERKQGWHDVLADTYVVRIS